MSEPSKSNRREFLTLGLTGDSNEETLEASPQSNARPPGSAREWSHLEVYSHPAMACEFELFFNMHEFPNAGETAMKTFELIDRFEDILSIFRESSELSYVNSHAFSRDVSLSPTVLELLELGLECSRQTGGAFDMASGALSDIWGFTRRDGRVPAREEINHVLQHTGSHQVELDSSASTVRFLRSGLKLNPGGIGKGLAVDHAVELILKENIDRFILHAGQSSVVARGVCLEGDSNSNGWKVGLSHPTIPGCRLAVIELVDQALGTSGTQRQGFFYRGKRYGHVIDPRTGYPSDHCLSSTVICRTAAMADALATAFFVMDLKEVQDFCQKNLDVSALLVLPTESSKPRIATFNTESIDIEFLNDPLTMQM